MPASGLELHPGALDDALSGYAWYLEHSEKAADVFFAELERAFDFILKEPEAWPPYLHGTRHFLLRDYPHSVVFKMRGDAVIVYAVAHARRRPGYWRSRLSSTVGL